MHKLNLPAVLLLLTHIKELKARTQTDICTAIFTEVLFTRAEMWKQAKCPSTGE